MKVAVIVAGLVWPALAFGQQLYTNADLEKFSVPGAYTNEDLKRLPPLVTQKKPAVELPPYQGGVDFGAAARYQGEYDSLRIGREALASELDYEIKLVEFSRSPFAGDPQSFEPRAGYGGIAKSLIQELQKRIFLIDRRIEKVLDDARKVGVLVDQR